MIDVKPQVGQALAADSQLVTALGGDHVYFYWPHAEARFPCVTYYEVGNEPIVGDEMEMAATVYMNVDLWAEDDPSSIAVHVDRIMSANGWRRESASDAVTEDGALFTRSLRYRQIFFVR